jgi:hypothetical protein
VSGVEVFSFEFQSEQTAVDLKIRENTNIPINSSKEMNMEKRNALICAAMVGLIAAGSVVKAAPAFAHEEKKAGKDGCKGEKKAHAKKGEKHEEKKAEAHEEHHEDKHE